MFNRNLSMFIFHNIQFNITKGETVNVLFSEINIRKPVTYGIKKTINFVYPHIQYVSDFCDIVCSH